MITEEQVWLDNIRDHQIGGKTDGLSPEVMEDLGFKPPERELTKLNIGAVATAKSQPVARSKSGRKLSMTPDAIAARKRRATQKTKINDAIVENADPWGPDLGGI